jgi:hypothetical protein
VVKSQRTCAAEAAGVITSGGSQAMLRQRTREHGIESSIRIQATDCRERSDKRRILSFSKTWKARA